MVGFMRKKKSDKVLLSGETALDRKGRVDGSSLLDGNGDPTEGTLYNQDRLAQKQGPRKSDEDENQAPHPNYPLAPSNYPPANYPYGQTYPPQQGMGFPQQPPHQLQQAHSYPVGNGGFGNSRGSFGNSNKPGFNTFHKPGFNNNNNNHVGGFGSHQTGYGNNQGGYPQQYPVQYGHNPQYPQQYGNPAAFPPQPETGKKSSFFRLPGYGKKK